MAPGSGSPRASRSCRSAGTRCAGGWAVRTRGAASSAGWRRRPALSGWPTATGSPGRSAPGRTPADRVPPRWSTRSMDLMTSPPWRVRIVDRGPALHPSLRARPGEATRDRARVQRTATHPARSPHHVRLGGGATPSRTACRRSSAGRATIPSDDEPARRATNPRQAAAPLERPPRTDPDPTARAGAWTTRRSDTGPAQSRHPDRRPVRARDRRRGAGGGGPVPRSWWLHDRRRLRRLHADRVRPGRDRDADPIGHPRPEGQVALDRVAQRAVHQPGVGRPPGHRPDRRRRRSRLSTPGLPGPRGSGARADPGDAAGQGSTDDRPGHADHGHQRLHGVAHRAGRRVGNEPGRALRAGHARSRASSSVPPRTAPRSTARP